MLQRLKLEHLPCQLSKTLCTALAPPLCAPTEIWAHQRALIMWFLSLRDHDSTPSSNIRKQLLQIFFHFSFAYGWMSSLLPVTSSWLGMDYPGHFLWIWKKKKKGILGILSLRPQAISSSFTFVIISETGILILFLYCY